MELHNNKKKNKIKKKKILILIVLISLLFQLKEKTSKMSHPKISIFLPIYNKSKYLIRAIKSIQIQTLRNIEIIPVNDCSKDNTLEILIKMKNNDSRIKIVNNYKNRGLLYSRAMGIINSKGEYLMNLDPDDELEGPDNLEFLYNITNIYKVDIVSFGFKRQFEFNYNKSIKCSNYNKIQYQPQIINSQYKFQDYLIWNKLIKKKLFLKAFELYKEKIYSRRWNYGEDEVWSTLVYKYAKSMICVNKIIYIYYCNKDSLMVNKYNILYLNNLIYWIKMLIKIMNNKLFEKHKTSRLSYLIRLIRNNNDIRSIIKNNTEIKKKYINIFKDFIINNDFDKKTLTSIISWLQAL